MAITNNQIIKWNKEFNSLSDADKRITIAKDVILQIKKERIIPSHTGYINSLTYDIELEDCSIQKYFNKVKCKCCALGSMFISNIKFNNKVCFLNLFLIDENKVVEELEKYFSLEQLILIEAAFEGWKKSQLTRGILSNYENGNYDYKNIYDKLNSHVIFLASLYKDSKKLIRKPSKLTITIMKNIIKNKGTFIPNENFN